MQIFVHVTTSTEQGSRIKGRVDPTSVPVLVRDETKCSESGSMVRTFIPHDFSMTVDMLHGDTKPHLGLEQQLLTGQTQRNIRACLHRLHTYASSMF